MILKSMASGHDPITSNAKLGPPRLTDGSTCAVWILSRLS